ncbi:MAG TPA: FkbM family methyltransferase [Candidatus Thiothrix moscowensis]|uniref:FkbM family methyltransferase n=1 Tax=unclassified Thiothrix TaxID=2636184 RepID=UPI0025D2F2E7|nr:MULTISPECIES: FkbM family methyltransferase [unclassified Thiothrix]HRJ54152.1 FkbM family methyltransferase [Candidatus Thiothrix moscowensis]HRJ94356.1 FkbM family methyltransferase [Candidatus Thiothrix moscowensis]
MKILNRIFKNNVHKKVSYSQCGEDLIIDFLRQWLGLTDFSYLDIGTNHPINLNNTYYFYKLGFSGILVEPDTKIADVIKKKRPHDIFLRAAISSSHQESISFYEMSSDTLNTTQASTAELYEQISEHQIIAKETVPNLHINTLLEKHFPITPPSFVSLDVEGMDLAILEAWDFNICPPPILCIETLTYSQNKSSRKISEIFEIMQENNYFSYADTYINTIFLHKDSWEQRIN